MKNEHEITGNKEKKKYPWTVRRVMALVGIILLLAMYGMTMVFALMGSPASKNLLMAAIFCTIAVPILLYAMQSVARGLKGKGRGVDSDDSSGETARDDVSETHSKETTDDGRG